MPINNNNFLWNCDECRAAGKDFYFDEYGEPVSYCDQCEYAVDDWFDDEDESSEDYFTGWDDRWL